jgi:hypothetical protein
MKQKMFVLRDSTWRDDCINNNLNSLNDLLNSGWRVINICAMNSSMDLGGEKCGSYMPSCAVLLQKDGD